MEDIGKTFIILGIVIVGMGLLFMATDKVPFVGKLPGDILVRKDNFTFYFPLATSILLSFILSFFFWLYRR